MMSSAWVIKKHRGEYLWDDLSTKDMDCNCEDPDCHYTLVNLTLLSKFRMFHTAVKKDLPNFSITVNSGFRCQTYNHEVGGTFNSRHTLGSALDLALPEDESDKIKFVALARAAFPFVLRYNTFIHVDVRDE